MNQRNVEALTDLYVEWMGMKPATMPLPQFFASRGVLVPSALAEEDMWFISDAINSESDVGWNDVALAMERVAKGETLWRTK